MLYRLPDYIGISGNQKANPLEKKTTTTLFVGPDAFCGIGMSTHQKELRTGHCDFEEGMTIDGGEVPSLKPLQLLQFIKSLRLNGQSMDYSSQVNVQHQT